VVLVVLVVVLLVRVVLVARVVFVVRVVPAGLPGGVGTVLEEIVVGVPDPPPQRLIGRLGQ